MELEDLDPETRRLNWGWFGEPWPSEVCYEGYRLRDEMRKDFPEGESCLWCGQPFAEGDAGMAFPLYDGSVTITHVHKECQLFTIVGSPGLVRSWPEPNTKEFRDAAVAAMRRRTLNHPHTREPEADSG